ncbi:hypothetical protein POX_d05667 [Penicillium oxalicum]|uniref:hypothetical protein n=1 Tax=Penicillium oxalicum TaxID=69781 RepID=UPI0020B7543D|nr:hypothetical protein POX_d05667 [Penicillium oxalicum]KAI2790161.1 hypothetical protein POX_d05667 [Penicillium oxalicum]
MDWDLICFNAAVLIAGVFVLDFGADKFLNHTVIVGQRLRISPTLIALLTAGAEYEELAVVIAAILQGQSPLALGNVVGSAISNILGAFSLGLLCHPGHLAFDQSAKIYSSVLFFITTIFVVLAYLNLLNAVTGGLFLGGFVLYIMSVGYAIYSGIAEAPQLSDSDSEGDSDSDSDIDNVDEAPTVPSSHEIDQESSAMTSENSPLLADRVSRSKTRSMIKPRRSIVFHIFQLFFGLIALSLSGYIIAHSAGALTESLHLSETVFGLTVIAFATTLPEKFISVLSGARGQGGIVVATTAGSNIFLLTICVGVIAIAGKPITHADDFVVSELATAWVSSACLLAIVFLGSSRVAGVLLLAGYVAFVVLEFTTRI